MNPETTSCGAEGPAGRAGLAFQATAALEALAERMGRELDRHAAAHGLSDAKLEMLGVLSCCSNRRACLYDLGDRLGVTRPNITKLVDGLERCGLVERLPHPADRRMVQAHLTPEGERIAREALPGRAERIERLWAALDEDELETLIGLLRRAGARAGAAEHAPLAAPA